jgi:hypothetical protein
MGRPHTVVKIAEQRDFSTVVWLLIQQDGHNLACGLLAAEMARTRWLGWC